jgi:hypothetical protein
MPAAHDAGDFRRLPEAQPGKRRDGLGIVVAAGEHEAADVARQLRRGLEQARRMLVDQFEGLAQGAGEVIGRGKAGKPRQALELGPVARQLVALGIGDHLDAVLDAAQEAVGVFQVGGRLGRDPLGGSQAVEHVDGARVPELGVAAAGDQLLGLDEELDFADAAAAQLDVVAVHGDLAVALHLVDLALQRLDVGDGREIEILAPDIGLEAIEELLSEGRSPATGRALIIAARSQFWPMYS